MPLTITLPDRESTLAFHRQRWAEVLADPSLRHESRRIETNAFGNIVMSPPPSGPHTSRQSEIAHQLRRLLGGKSFGVCPLVTADGVKEADAAWYSLARYETVRGQLAFETAPEICVEVVSPSNTDTEMNHKRALYFEAGAIECWQCDLQGKMTYFLDNNPSQPHSQSELCPDFPMTISD